MNENDFSSFALHNAKEQGKKIKMINNKVKECQMKLRLMCTLTSDLTKK